MLSDIKDEIECRLNRKIDLIHGPIEGDSFIKIDKAADIYVLSAVCRLRPLNYELPTAI